MPLFCIRGVKTCCNAELRVWRATDNCPWYTKYPITAHGGANVTLARKAKKKAGPKPCSNALTKYRSSPIGVFFGVAASFSRRRFSSHRLGPQPPERNIVAQMRSIQRISYSYPTPVHFVTMVVVHCTINDQAAGHVPAPRRFSAMGRPFERLPRL